MSNELEEKALIEDFPQKDSNFDKFEPKDNMELYKQSYRDLKDSPKELWVLYTIRFCFYGSFYSFLSCISIFLSDVHELSDSYIAIVYLIEAFFAMFMIVVLGYFPDLYGIKLSMILGSFTSLAMYSLVMINENFYYQITIIVIIGGFSVGFYISALESGVKYYTKADYRTLALSFSALVGYISLICGGIVIEIMFYIGEKDQATFRILFIFCAILSFISLICSFFLRQLDYENEKETVLKKSQDIDGYNHTRQVMILKKF